MTQKCKCGKGHKSLWDDKCGKCRTKHEQKNHEYALSLLSDIGCTTQEDARKMYKEIRKSLK